MPTRAAWNLVAVLAVLGAVAILARLDDDREGAEGRPSSGPSGASSTSEPARTASPAASAAAGDRATPAVMPRMAAASASELCAFGPVFELRLLSDEEESRRRALLAEPRGRLVTGLRQRGDAPSNALGLLVAAQAAIDEARRSEASAARALCGVDGDCAARTAAERAALSGAGSREIESLLRFASASRDPFVHAIAHEACARPSFRLGGRPPPACEATSGAQWAAIEPGNAVAWVHAAAAASAAGDPAGVDAALLRASRATGARLYGDSAYGLVAAALPADAPEADRTAAHVIGAEIVSTWTLPPYITATRWCSAAAVRDADRRQQCGDLAGQLAERGRTLMDLGIGIAIERRIDPQSARAADWAERRDALMQTMLAPTADRDPDPRGCAAMGVERSFLARASTHGETHALAERLAASGLPQTEAARRLRADLDARVAAAASGASAIR